MPVAENKQSVIKIGRYIMNISEEEKQKFAAGGASTVPSDCMNAETENAETENADGLVISPRCPKEYLKTRDGFDYGTFEHVTYYSKTCKMERGFSILFPPSYSASAEKTYPVLYLLHGIFGDEFSFSNDENNRIKEILGNMSADGIIEDTILVCPNMYATDDPEQKPAFDNEACIPYDNFINELINDLMPYVEANYSVKKGRENTYLAGFSMGGRETTFITLKASRLFGYACAISSAPGLVPTEDKFMKHEGQITKDEMRFADAIEPIVLMLCCGTQDSVVGSFPKMYHEILNENGVKHIWYEIPGVDHNNDAVQSGLYNLLKAVGTKK